MSTSVSVIQVRNVLLVTVPSDPSDAVVAELQQRVLDTMAEFRPKGAILDISQIDVIDSFFARTITETARMVTLMGGPTIITGMRPAVAITAMELGLHLEGVVSALNVNKALDMLETMEGV
jgi:rsbT antagonist protein RsbS